MERCVTALIHEQIQNANGNEAVSLLSPVRKVPEFASSSVRIATAMTVANVANVANEGREESGRKWRGP